MWPPLCGYEHSHRTPYSPDVAVISCECQTVAVDQPQAPLVMEPALMVALDVAPSSNVIADDQGGAAGGSGGGVVGGAGGVGGGIDGGSGGCGGSD